MTDKKWTQGPWEVDGIAVSGGDIHSGDVCLMGEPAQWSGDTPRMLNNCDANANLIAAAPDLYEACEDAFLALLSAREFILKKYGSTNPAREDAINACRAALAKARGEP